MEEIEEPCLYGLHNNAEISALDLEGKFILSSLIQMGGGVNSEGKGISLK
jgi:hypothetical protein